MESMTRLVIDEDLRKSTEESLGFREKRRILPPPEPMKIRVWEESVGLKMERDRTVRGTAGERPATAAGEKLVKGSRRVRSFGDRRGSIGEGIEFHGEGIELEVFGEEEENRSYISLCLALKHQATNLY